LGFILEPQPLLLFDSLQKHSGILGSKELHQPFPNLVVKV
jgi:hypothetical protein